jgi:hypothetical protein
LVLYGGKSLSKVIVGGCMLTDEDERESNKETKK